MLPGLFHFALLQVSFYPLSNFLLLPKLFLRRDAECLCVPYKAPKLQYLAVPFG